MSRMTIKSVNSTLTAIAAAIFWQLSIINDTIHKMRVWATNVQKRLKALEGVATQNKKVYSRLTALETIAASQRSWINAFAREWFDSVDGEDAAAFMEDMGVDIKHYTLYKATSPLDSRNFVVWMNRDEYVTGGKVAYSFMRGLEKKARTAGYFARLMSKGGQGFLHVSAEPMKKVSMTKSEAGEDEELF